MEYLALYRKYRPIKFAEVVGQDNIVKTIHNAIVHNKISHAYLLCGPRGTGKTTTAKLIARMVNCTDLVNGEPCGKCKSCLSISENNNDDIVEIDAASNNGVDEIREIRDKVNLVPSISKYKVYIIDEVHMLSTGAFNALLKTLEEPPKHVIFVLATTEEQKIPATIISRCQKFNFSKLSIDSIVKQLKNVAAGENIVIDDAVLTEIARFSDGGMRDAINMFDQLVSSVDGSITIDDVYKTNGIVSFSDICNFLLSLKKGDLSEILSFVDKVDASGKNLSRMLDEMILVMKDVLVYKCCPGFKLDNSKTKYISDLSLIYDIDNIYYFIENVDNLINSMRTSGHAKILMQVFFVKFVDFLNKNSSSGNKIISQEKGKNMTNNLDSLPEVSKIKHLDEKPGNKIISQEKGKNIVNDLDLLPEAPEIKRLDEKSGNKIISQSENYFPGNNFEDNIYHLSDEDNEIYNNIKSIRVNNALAMANKNLLLSIKSQWNLIDDYLLDDKYGIIAGLLNDTMVAVASEEVLLLVSENNSVATRLWLLDKEIDDFLKKIFEKVYKIVVISNKEWLEEKRKFVENKKNNITYKVIDEKEGYSSVKKEAFVSKKSVNDGVNDLINIVGNDIIEFK